MWVGLTEREREWSEEKNGRWRKTEGKREISEQQPTQQGSEN